MKLAENTTQHDKPLFGTFRAAVLCHNTRREITLSVFLQCQVLSYSIFTGEYYFLKPQSQKRSIPAATVKHRSGAIQRS